MVLEGDEGQDRGGVRENLLFIENGLSAFGLGTDKLFMFGRSSTVDCVTGKGCYSGGDREYGWLEKSWGACLAIGFLYPGYPDGMDTGPADKGGCSAFRYSRSARRGQGSEISG